MLLNYNEPTQIKFTRLTFDVEIDGEPHSFDLSKRFLKRGSPVGFLFEDFFAEILSEQGYEHTSQSKLYDYENTNTLHLIEAKTTMGKGLKLAPSGNYGKGRILDKVAFQTEAKKKDFLLGDMSELATNGIVGVVLIRGEEAALIGPNVNAATTAKLFGK